MPDPVTDMAESADGAHLRVWEVTCTVILDAATGEAAIQQARDLVDGAPGYGDWSAERIS